MKTQTLHIRCEKPYDYWLKKNWYYHSIIARLYCSFIPAHARVLQISCKNGFLLAATKPSYGVGIDEDLQCINDAQQRHQNLHFHAGNLNSLPKNETFDYIMISLATMETDDVQLLFEQLRAVSHEKTKIIIEFYSSLWEPVLWITQKLSLRRATIFKNWLSLQDIRNFLSLAHFETITTDRYILLPYYIPLLSWLLNTFIAPLPLLNKLCLSQWVVARPVPVKKSGRLFGFSNCCVSQ